MYLPSTAIHLSTPTYLFCESKLLIHIGVLRVLSNIYDGAFAKIFNGFHLLDICQSSENVSWPFKCQANKMIKHIQSIRRRLSFGVFDQIDTSFLIFLDFL